MDAARYGLDEAALARLRARVDAVGAAGTALEADVVLAWASAEGSAVAIAELETRFARELPGALSRVGLTREQIDEVGQTVRERLLVARKIAEYAGRGSLEGFLRAVIVRAGIDLRRREAIEPVPTDDEPLARVAGASEDPEIENLRARYAEPFRLALLDALRALPADERNALRLNVVEGLNIEQIGDIYGVHRATIARWIAHARETVANETRRLLAQRLGLDGNDLDSLVRLCRSRIDVGPSILVG